MSALENKEDDAAWERMESELSRLRDLVREMRDSLDDVTRMLEVAFMTDYEPQQGSVGGIAKALIAKADAAIKESGETVKYGCHGIKGSVYETCMLDTKDAEDCHLGANNGLTDKATCPHWRPIK